MRCTGNAALEEATIQIQIEFLLHTIHRKRALISKYTTAVYRRWKYRNAARMDEDLILIKIHHGGSFSMEGELTYNGGEVSNFPDYDGDRTSYFRLVRLAKTVGWKDGDDLYYKVPGKTLENGIDLVHNDDSVRKMLSFAKKNNLAELYIKHNGHEGLPVNPRNGPNSDDKLLEEIIKPKETKLKSKKRDKRTWTAEEEKLLIDILYEMNDSCWKVDTGHKSGYLTYIEKKMAIKLPHADLKADPHIKSKVKILKKQLSYILEIMQYGSGFGWDDEKKMVTGDRETYNGWAKSREGAGALYMKPMVNFDKLCEIYANDLAKGEGAKGPGEDVVEVEPTKDGQQNSELREGDVPHTHDNINTSGGYKNGRKRTYPDADTLEMGFVNISNSFAKFLEAEQQNTNTMNAIYKSMQHESEAHENTSSNTDKLLEILQDLPGLTTEEAVMAIRVIGEDVGKTKLFVKMRDGFRLEYVRQELHAAKKK